MEEKRIAVIKVMCSLAENPGNVDILKRAYSALADYASSIGARVPWNDADETDTVSMILACIREELEEAQASVHRPIHIVTLGGYISRLASLYGYSEADLKRIHLEVL